MAAAAAAVARLAGHLSGTSAQATGIDRFMPDVSTPPTEPSPSSPRPGDDPIIDLVAGLVAKLKSLEDDPGQVLTCEKLLQIVGVRSHGLAIFIFSLLNLLPAPPGYNFLMALIIVMMSGTMLVGREIRLTRYLGRIKLPVKLVLKLLGMLSHLVGWIAKVSAPRLPFFTGPAAQRGIALVGIILGIAMLVPIPFTNMVPSIGLVMICIGLLNRDGLLVLAGVGVGFIGLALLLVAAWVLISLGLAIEDAVDGETEATPAA